MAKIVDQRQRTAVRAKFAERSTLQQKRQKAGMRVGIGMLIVLSALALIWLLVRFAISAYWSATVERLRVSPGDFQVKIATKGFLLRDEVLFVAPQGGIVTAHVGEGEYVDIWEHIISIDNAYSAQTLLEQIAEVEQQIAVYDDTVYLERIELNESVNQDLQVLQQKTARLRIAVAGNDRENIRVLEQEIRDLNASRLAKEALRDQLPADPETLQERLATLWWQVEQTGTEVRTSEEGFLSFWIDGAENAYSLESFSQINADMILSPPVSVDCSRNREVRAGAPLFKIVSEGAWRWVGLIPLDRWTKPEDRLLYFNCDYIASDATLQHERLQGYLIDAREDKGMQRVTVEFAGMLPLALPQRGVNYDYILREARGLVLDERFLLQHDGRQGILIIDPDGLVRFEEVHISEQEGEQVLLENYLQTIDIITNPTPRMIGLRLK